MRSFFNLFRRSPFAALQSHMQSVARCIHLLPELYEAFTQKNTDRLQALCEIIDSLEHHADIAKNDIRNHLPKGLFLPIDRGYLLEILSMQDLLADRVEDLAVLFNIKPIDIPQEFQAEFKTFIEKNIQAFDSAQKIIQEMGELVEYSFGGLEAEKVRALVDDVASKEHDADLLQRPILKKLFSSENELHYTSFFLWLRIIEATASISDLSQKLANRVRMTLELK